MSRQTKSILLFIVLVLIWGSAFILIKQGLKALTPLQVGSLRVLAASIVLSPFAIGQFKKIKKSEWFYILTSGIVGSLLPAILFAVGMENGISSSTAGVLSALTPAFTVILGIVFFKSRVSWLQVVGLILGFGGALSLLIIRSKSGIDFNNYGWLIVLATFFYALNLILVKFKLKETKPILISSISLIFTIPFTLGTLFFTTDFETITFSNQVYKAIGFSALLGVLATGIALQLFNQLIKISTPIFSSSITYAIPIMAILWALVVGETVDTSTYFLTTIIILSIYLIRKDESRSS